MTVNTNIILASHLYPLNTLSNTYLMKFLQMNKVYLKALDKLQNALRAYRNHVPHLLVKQYCISTISVAHYRKPRLEDVCWQKCKILTGTCFLVCIQHISFSTLACVRNTIVDTNMLAVMSLSASIWTCKNINWLGYSVNRSFAFILIIRGMA